MVNDQAQIVAESSVQLPFPAEQVYRVIADYEVGHPAIVPKKFFKGIRVLKGGYGAGTVVEVTMRVFGIKQTFELEITEPKPGEVLAEESKSMGARTEFHVTPLETGAGCQLSIHSQIKRKRGLRGWIESIIHPRVIKQICQAEFQLLTEYLQAETESS